MKAKQKANVLQDLFIVNSVVLKVLSYGLRFTLRFEREKNVFNWRGRAWRATQAILLNEMEAVCFRGQGLQQGRKHSPALLQSDLQVHHQKSDVLQQTTFLTLEQDLFHEQEATINIPYSKRGSQRRKEERNGWDTRNRQTHSSSAS